MPSLLDLSSEELISKGIAPIKKSHLLPFISKSAAPAKGEAAKPTAATAAQDTTSESKVVAKKSKRQTRKDLKFEKSKQAGLCNNFIHGKCHYGDRCKYSHDTSAYLANKQPDLPGRCPFSLLDLCPYGITCRWAASHQDQQQHLTSATAVNGELSEQPAVVASAPATAGATAGEHTALAPIAAADLQAVASLPLIQSIQPPVNGLSKAVQQQLWKGTYDFSKSEEVLQGLGLTTHAGKGKKHQQQQKQQQPKRALPEPATADTQANKRQRDTTAVAAASVAVQTVQSGSCDELDALYSQEETAAATPVAAVMHHVQDSAPAAAAPAVLQQDTSVVTQQPQESSAVATLAAADADTALDSLYEAEESALAAAAAAAEHNASAAATIEAAAAAIELLAAAPTPQALPATDAALVAQLQSEQQQQQGMGCCLDPGHEPRNKPKLDIASKTYLAPLTTVGNLPFRRLCVGLGCQVTCGEMALATNLLQGQNSEWALLKRHPCEKMFGIQVCGGYPDAMSQLAQVVNEHVDCDFVDINCGCPIDVICNRGAGSALLTRPKQLERVVRATTGCLDKPVIVKIRKGYYDDTDIAHTLIPQMRDWGAAACTLHGRSRQQRYSRAADWEYIERCASIAQQSGLPLIGNGDVFSPTEWATRLQTGVTTAMIGRAALIKPWLFTEIQEQRLWDISASERLDLFKTYVSHGLEHWGSDSRGVENTRRFLLEWLSFTHRYIPVGLLDVVPQKMSWRPPAYLARNQLEALMASEAASDWVKISEMLLGPAPPGFTFAPKHKSNAYTASADASQQLVGAAQTTVPRQHFADEDGQENG